MQVLVNRWWIAASLAVVLASFSIGCGPGGERAADVLPDPGADPAAGADVPTGDLSKQSKK